MKFEEARDAIFKVFLDAWDATGYPVTWTDVASEINNSETVWARVVLRHADGGQASLGGEIGSKRWERSGILFVQVFAPVGDGSTAAYNAAQLVADAFQSVIGSDVWFRNVRINEVGSNGAFEQINVLVNFFYDDVR